MAGFVAQQLADWNYWDVATEYAALLKSNAIKDPASEFAIVNYLQRAAVRPGGSSIDHPNPTGELHGAPVTSNPSRARESPNQNRTGHKLGTKAIPSSRRWLREPLLHFLLAGAILFATYELVNPAANRTDQINQIVLTEDDLRQLAVVWLAQGRRPPTADEMRALVEERVRQEILFREARAPRVGQG